MFMRQKKTEDETSSTKNKKQTPNFLMVACMAA